MVRTFDGVSVGTTHCGAIVRICSGSSILIDGKKRSVVLVNLPQLMNTRWLRRLSDSSQRHRQDRSMVEPDAQWAPELLAVSGNSSSLWWYFNEVRWGRAFVWPTLAALVRASLQTLLHRTAFFRPTTAVGQNEPPSLVAGGDRCSSISGRRCRGRPGGASEGPGRGDNDHNEMIYAKTPKTSRLPRRSMWRRSARDAGPLHGNDSSHIRRSCTTGRCFIRHA
jgi:hypothetical protein